MNNDWCRLDNAAKIFPSADNGADTQVFRFSCETADPIKHNLLQTALEETLELFDMYRYTMKRGLFWYYLERTDLVPVVQKEHKPPCSAIYHKDRESLLFEVTYFHNRINLDVYHVLSDGTGAMQFFRTLVMKYICARYGIAEIPLDYVASQSQMKHDSFAKYYSRHNHIKKQKFNAAYRLKGKKFPENQLKIIIGHVPLTQLLSIAKKYDVTLTAFLCACLMEAIAETFPHSPRRKNIVLSVPVNLRKFFPSETARNFFSLIFTEYNFSDPHYNFETLVKKINTDLKENLTLEVLLNNINAFSSIEHNFFAKITPLFLKNFFLHYAYLISMMQSTAAVSNLGLIKMPREIEPYLRSFDVYTGTNKLQLCLCSYQNILSMSVTSPYINTNIQQRFFQKLSALGIQVELLSNEIN